MLNGHKIPHSLRLIAFLLRLALGLNFFYLGVSGLFDSSLSKAVQNGSLTGLYSWLSNPANAGPLQTFFQWALLVIGALLVVGLFTRLSAFAGIALVTWNLAPALTVTSITPSEFINGEIVAILCLLILILADTGSFFGLDAFFHKRRRRRAA